MFQAIIVLDKSMTKTCFPVRAKDKDIHFLVLPLYVFQMMDFSLRYHVNSRNA